MDFLKTARTTIPSTTGFQNKLEEAVVRNLLNIKHKALDGCWIK